MLRGIDKERFRKIIDKIPGHNLEIKAHNLGVSFHILNQVYNGGRASKKTIQILRKYDVVSKKEEKRRLTFEDLSGVSLDCIVEELKDRGFKVKLETDAS